MTVSKKFIRTWHTWQHIPEIKVNLRRYPRDARIRGIIDELDHLHSYVYGLGLDVIAGNIEGKAQYAAEELASLRRLSSELNTCDLLESERQELKSYIEMTRSLLNEMTKLSLPS